MRPRLLASLFALSIVAPTLAAPASAVVLDVVIVGDPGNPPHPAAYCFQPDCGSVGDAYAIGAYEVTNAQYPSS